MGYSAGLVCWAVAGFYNIFANKNIDYEFMRQLCEYVRDEPNPLGEALGVFMFLYSYLAFRESTNNGDPSKYV